MLEENEGEQTRENVEELRTHMHELEQKLAMSEQAVDDKELQAIRTALESAKSEAVMDVELLREEEKWKRNELECELRETTKRLEVQNQGLHEFGGIQCRGQKSGD